MQLKTAKGNQKLTIFNIALVVASLMVSTSLLANETDMQVAAITGESAHVTKSGTEDIDDEIGSTDTFEFDNQIGAFSREDGAMMGAYGDGEYAD